MNEPGELTRPSLFGVDASGQVGKRADFWNPTLNIQFVEGHCMAFLYSHLLWMNFEPSRGIIFHFSTHTVKIDGRNLRGLYDELLELRCRSIVVVNEEHDLESPDAVVVHRVGVRQEQPGGSQSNHGPPVTDGGGGKA